MRYVDLNVHLSPGVDGRYKVAAECDRAGEASGELELPFRLEELADSVFGVSSMVRDLTPTAPAPDSGGLSDTPKVLGAQLFRALFKDEIRDLLSKAQGAIQHERDLGIRIRLKMDLKGEGMAELASLPWELMAPDDDIPLVLSKHTVVARSLSVLQPSQLPPGEPPLRIMVVCSNPEGTGQLDLEKERERVEKSWALLPGVRVDFVRATYGAVAEYLADEDPDVLHFMGHGEFDAEAGGSLILETEDGRPHAVDSDQLRALFRDERALRLVFLNACKTAAGGTEDRAMDPFAGVAASLIRIGIPAVVAMQFPISDVAAIEFADTFYRRIARGAPIDTAVAEARKRLYAKDRSEWATPVLFLRSLDGDLFPTPAPEADPGPASPPPAPMATSGPTPGPELPPDAALEQVDPASAAFSVFLATPTDALRPTYRQIRSELEAEGVRIIGDVPPPYDEAGHREAVEEAVRTADLCVHLLGERPGEPLDDGGGRTYPIEQLKIGLEAARSQLILFPEHIDFQAIEDPSYRELLSSLSERSRDADRFEIVRTGRHQMVSEIRSKRRRLEQRIAGGSNGGVHSAFVDFHASDMGSASALVQYLTERNIAPLMSASMETTPAAGLKLFEENLSKVPLLIVVFGGVEKDWVVNRLNQAVRVVTTNSLSTRIGVYVAPPDKGDDGAAFPPFYDVLMNMQGFDPATVETLIDKVAEDRA